MRGWFASSILFTYFHLDPRSSSTPSSMVALASLILHWCRCRKPHDVHVGLRLALPCWSAAPSSRLLSLYYGCLIIIMWIINTISCSILHLPSHWRRLALLPLPSSTSSSSLWSWTGPPLFPIPLSLDSEVVIFIFNIYGCREPHPSTTSLPFRCREPHPSTTSLHHNYFSSRWVHALCFSGILVRGAPPRGLEHP